MVRRLAALPLALSVVCASACGSSTATNVSAPTTVRCQPGVSAPSTSFGNGGGTGTVSVTVARECAWSATPDAPWIVITSGREGQGDGTVAYRIEANGDPVTRRGGISVNDQRVQLAQDAAPCRFTVSAPGAAVPAAGGQIPVSIRTHSLCGWTAQEQAPWVVATPDSGRGDGTVQVTVQPNPGAERSAELRVEGETVEFVQSAALPPPGNPPPPSPGPPPPPGPAPPPAPGPTPGRRIDLEGRVRSLRGACPTLEFTLEGRRVFTTAETQFRRGPCSDLEDGTRIDLEGREMSDGTVRGDEIAIRRDDDDDE
jgi:hypothetical protein